MKINMTSKIFILSNHFQIANKSKPACKYDIEMFCITIRKKDNFLVVNIKKTQINNFYLPKIERSTTDAIGKTQIIPKRVEKYLTKTA